MKLFALCCLLAVEAVEPVHFGPDPRIVRAGSQQGERGGETVAGSEIVTDTDVRLVVIHTLTSCLDEYPTDLRDAEPLQFFGGDEPVTR